jgi:hypothetical protein
MESRGERAVEIADVLGSKVRIIINNVMIYGALRDSLRKELQIFGIQIGLDIKAY